MTFGTSALQRENVRHASSMTPAVASPSQRPRPTGVDRSSPSGPPIVTWIGPMEVMMEGCRYRLVPADSPANQTMPAPTSTNGANIEPLTPRESQIARLVADGYVNKEIAS